MDTRETTGRIPAHWVTYFANGESSHMTDEDEALADAWLAEVSEALGGVPTLEYGSCHEWVHMHRGKGGDGPAYDVTATVFLPETPKATT